MSLLAEAKVPIPPPRLDGREVLGGDDPSVAKVKGVIFAGRKAFLTELVGEEGLAAILSKLSPKTAGNLRTPLAASWCDFSSLIELDRTMYEMFRGTHPNILALAGAASAAYGIGKVYKSLDTAELSKFFESQALFHSQFQKFGRVRYEPAPKGGRMIYTNYSVYSPVYCATAVGFFMESILRHGATNPAVAETSCQTHGDDACIYEMSWQ